MKNPTTPTEKPAPKAEQSVATVASEIKAKKASPTPKPTAKPKAAAPKPVPKVKAEQPVAVAATETKAIKPSQPPKSLNNAQVVASNLVAETPEITLPERVGLTAGSIWHYLSENGASPVAKLVRELPEEEKVIQRSIGWLAQEGKITLDSIDRVETIGSTG
jgi:Winged helix-turn-helix domain (DUF2582)